eukprot:6049842-Karenia_brevis.AAC.1
MHKRTAHHLAPVPGPDCSGSLALGPQWSLVPGPVSGGEGTPIAPRICSNFVDDAGHETPAHFDAIAADGLQLSTAR